MLVDSDSLKLFEADSLNDFDSEADLLADSLRLLESLIDLLTFSENEVDWLSISESFSEASLLLIVLLEIAVDKLADSIVLKRSEILVESDSYSDLTLETSSLSDVLADSDSDLLLDWLTEALTDLLVLIDSDLLLDWLADSLKLADLEAETL